MRTKAVALTLALAFLLTATIRCDDGSPPPPPGPDNYCAYLPTALNNWWEYKVTVESMFSPREEYKLTLEIKDTKDNYEGFPTAYVITVTKEGSSPEEIIVAPDGDDCYVERVAWAYLIGDAMYVGEWSQTGLVGDFPLEYVRDVEIKVPAQKDEFRCREYFLDNGNEFKPESWRELYAKDVGLVYYENNFKQYQIDPFELVDWRVVKYELKGYDVKKHQAPTF
ncbi:MAG: hypothetical protein V3W11_02800 [bacterium]